MTRAKYLAAAAVLTTLFSTAYPAIAQDAENCSAIAGVEDFQTQGWGFTKSNERFQTRTTINRDNVDKLKVKWAFALDGGMGPHSYPLVTEDTVFIGAQSGKLYALERDTGCVRWSYDAGNEARTAIIHGVLPGENGDEPTLFFGTANGRTHAVDAATGKGRWITDVRDHSMGMLTGTAAYHDGRLYVPVSSTEVVMAAMPWYGCCTFRGAIVALDAFTGDFIWRTHVVAEEPEVTGSHFWFVQSWGPSGAPIWSAPTIDPERGRLYVGTGENYSSPASDMSDAIVAMDLETGTIEWVRQYLAGDAFNVACGFPNHPNCPDEDGPDLDFGAPPILTKTPAGEPIILAGQKSGGVYGLSAETGEPIWERFFGRGGLVGGIHWGMAVNPQSGLLFVPINDMQYARKVYEGTPEPGLYALDIATGKLVWSNSVEGSCDDRTPCDPGLSAAIAATADLVFAGGLDGYIRAYNSDTGKILWEFDSWKTYEAANGGEAIGGTIDTHGPMITGNMMFIQSGYANQLLKGGNALLAFEVAE